MRFRLRRDVARLVCTAFLLLTSNAAWAAIHEVTVGDNFFSPSELTIEVGDTVRWINATGGAIHNVTSSDDAWVPSATASSFTFEVVFNDPGSFGYLCTIHPGSMQGTITVEGGNMSAAELAVTAFSAGNGPFSAGQEVTFNTTIQNTGDADSGATSLDFFAQPSGGSVQAGEISLQSIPGDAVLIGTKNIANVPQGGSVNDQSTIAIPASIPPGNYVIGVTLNFSDTNSGNNELTDADIVQFVGEFFINSGLNDAWVNADAAFQGLFFTVFPDIGLLFLSWFTFDSVLPAGEDTATFGAHDHRWVTASGLFSP
ncbi:MAG: hypothetical protein HKO64_07215, partial [Xanthomonadales bacterium]|nr:hypothetical protein [Xanthomonadales bacterium]